MKLFGRGHRGSEPIDRVDLAARLESPADPATGEPEGGSSNDAGSAEADRVEPVAATPETPQAGVDPSSRAAVTGFWPGTGAAETAAGGGTTPGGGLAPAQGTASMPVDPAPGRSSDAEASDRVAVPPPDPHIDGLTDLLGPVLFERLLAAESARARRYQRPESIVIAELVGLDGLGRSWGEDVARTAVTSLAAVLRSGSRTSDYVARIASDRFAILLTETDEIAAINYVERVREAWEGQRAIAGGGLRVGFGWAGTPRRETLAAARTIAEEVLAEDLRQQRA